MEEEKKKIEVTKGGRWGSAEEIAEERKTRKLEKKRKKRKEQKGRKGMIITEPVAGTRDFFPKDMRYRNWLFAKWKKTARLFAFEEYDAPVLEPAELYKRKAGEEIVEQMYNFREKSDLEVTLRPEMTPSLARLILKGGTRLVFPIRWFSLPQCWRYETLCKGRKREHYQWNMDIFGVPGVTAETELLAAIVFFLKDVGFTSKDIKIKVSSRKLLQNILDKFKIKKEMFEKTCVIIDKLDKVGDKAVIEMLEETCGIEEEISEKILAIIRCKDISKLKDHVGEKSESFTDLSNLFKYAKGFKIDEWLVFDGSVVRGLAYYTGIVFEVFSLSTSLKRAIAGGGRYDKILQIYGAKRNIPACGFGFGDVVIMEVLSELKLLPKLEYKVDDIIIPFSFDLYDKAGEVASILRGEGRIVDVYMKKTKRIGQAYTYADKRGAARAIFVAPDEWEKGMVRVKYLNWGKDVKVKQFNVKLEDLAKFEKKKEDFLEKKEDVVEKKETMIEKKEDVVEKK